MKPRIKRPRRFPLAIALLTAMIALGGVALASSTLVTVEVKGQYTKRHRTACHEVNKFFKFFHRSSTVEWEGLATPAPTSHFSVRLEVKHCIGGTWVKIKDHFTTGKPLTGDFRGFFPAKPLAPRSHKAQAVNYYRARAIVGPTRSLYEYFAVTH
jgi:hypothetical protein